jgi:hypothetical protein
MGFMPMQPSASARNWSEIMNTMFGLRTLRFEIAPAPRTPSQTIRQANPVFSLRTLYDCPEGLPGSNMAICRARIVLLNAAVRKRPL